MAIGVRGFNPIWTEFDLQANIFDDTFYLFVLENTIPYIPETVYYDPDLNVPRTNPIQFLANGTLPVDIFFVPDRVYRLEFRQGPTQADPLIYEVNDYSPGTGGGDIPVTDSFSTTNQITNPQFSLVSFESPFTLSATNPDPIEVAPGWFLELGGTGTVTLNQVPLNNTNENPSNAPYALQITLVGWNVDEVFLRQRFQQNGMLWANKVVSSAITARVQGPFQTISANLVDSQGTPLAQVLAPTTVINSFEEYTGHDNLPESTNTDVPPSAYIDYKLSLPINSDIYVSSIQLIVQDDDNESEPSFEQDSIDRQIDHTFHYYRESILRQAKESLLTGWDFGLNPWQFRDKTQSNLANNAYTADQTIVVQQLFVVGGVGNRVSVGQSSDATNHGFQVQAVGATNQFALIQYIDARTVRASWGNIVSSLVRLTAQKQGGAPLRMKMRLIHRVTLPPTISQTQPISGWPALGSPDFTATGWTAIAPKNDPVYDITNGFNELYFEGFELPVESGNLMTLGIVLYTLDNMVETGTPDYIIFDQISLAQSDFAIETTKLSFDETLRRCQYYYAKSFEIDTVPATGITAGQYIFPQTVIAGGNGVSQSISLPVGMRIAPTLVLLNPVNANSLVHNTVTGTDCPASGTTSVSSSSFAITYTAVGGSLVGNGLTVQWTANAQLGA